jgi:predicted O-methyltransferase YrrM
MTEVGESLRPEMIWHDDNHLQIGDTSFLLTNDWDVADKTESTPDQFVLIKERRLVESALDHFPGSVERIVEFGIFKGGSVALFEELYSPERFVGVDLAKRDSAAALDEYLHRRSATDRVKLYYGTDQGDRQALETIAKENFGEGRSIDLVIDDGAHRYWPCKTSLEVFLPLLRPGGVYVLEDWGWANWPGEYHQEKASEGQYADQQYPLTKLVFEVVMFMASTSGELISDLWVDSSRVFMKVAVDPITEKRFDISRAYMSSLWNMEYEQAPPRGSI